MRSERTCPLAGKAAAALLAAALLAGAGIESGYAASTGTAEVVNGLTVASVEIELVESGGGGTHGIAEGTVEKTVAVENTGTGACYVRAAVELSSAEAERYAEIVVNTQAWTEKQADGYYYLREPLPVNATSAPLVTGVAIGAEPDGGYEDFELLALAEAAQARQRGSGEPYPDAQSAFAAHEG